MISTFLADERNFNAVLASGHSWISSRKIRVFPSSIMKSGITRESRDIIAIGLKSPRKASIADGVSMKLIL